MKGTSLTDISDSGNTKCKLSLYTISVILSVGKSNIVATNVLIYGLRAEGNNF